MGDLLMSLYVAFAIGSSNSALHCSHRYVFPMPWGEETEKEDAVGWGEEKERGKKKEKKGKEKKRKREEGRKKGKKQIIYFLENCDL